MADQQPVNPELLVLLHEQRISTHTAARYFAAREVTRYDTDGLISLLRAVWVNLQASRTEAHKLWLEAEPFAAQAVEQHIYLWQGYYRNLTAELEHRVKAQLKRSEQPAGKMQPIMENM